MASASAASVPTRSGTHSVAFAAAKLQIGSTTTIFIPRARASAALPIFEQEAWPAERSVALLPPQHELAHVIVRPLRGHAETQRVPPRRARVVSAQFLRGLAR